MLKTKLKPVGVWVKKLVRIARWNNYYSQVSDYCYLEKTDRGIWIGFLVANEVPFECQELNEAEKIRMQECREVNNTLPLPFNKKKDERNY